MKCANLLRSILSGALILSKPDIQIPSKKSKHDFQSEMSPKPNQVSRLQLFFPFIGILTPATGIRPILVWLLPFFGRIRNNCGAGGSIKVQSRFRKMKQVQPEIGIESRCGAIAEFEVKAWCKSEALENSHWLCFRAGNEIVGIKVQANSGTYGETSLDRKRKHCGHNDKSYCDKID
jgi:hypothetical protein